jgi:ABC-type phosphate transport system substrate-binding protein
MEREKSMKQLQILFVVVAMGILAAASLGAADLKVIANLSVGASSVSADELKGVFLATKTSLSDGSRVEPVLEKGGPIHEAFIKEYLGKTDAALHMYYRSLVFTGKASMPKTVEADADVVAYVAKTKGAIGYVSAGTATAGVKALEVK